jgi:hypothetical protein
MKTQKELNSFAIIALETARANTQDAAMKAHYTKALCFLLDIDEYLENSK